MTQPIRLGRELKLENLALVKTEFDQLLGRQQVPVLDAAELEQVDAAAIQLLFCLDQSLAGRGQTLVWQQPCRLIEAAAQALGLDIPTAPASEPETDDEDGFGFF